MTWLLLHIGVLAVGGVLMVVLGLSLIRRDKTSGESSDKVGRAIGAGGPWVWLGTAVLIAASQILYGHWLDTRFGKATYPELRGLPIILACCAVAVFCYLMVLVNSRAGVLAYAITVTTFLVTLWATAYMLHKVTDAQWWLTATKGLALTAAAVVLVFVIIILARSRRFRRRRR